MDVVHPLRRSAVALALAVLLALVAGGCSSPSDDAGRRSDPTSPRPTAPDRATMAVVRARSDQPATAERIAVDPAVDPSAVDVTVEIDLEAPRQELRGMGAALTESSAHLLAGLPAEERAAIIEELFAPDRGGLSVLRLVIGASDFSLEHRSLADSPEPDPELRTFSIERDQRWVIPVLQEILAIRPDLDIVASPWSAPGWMKDTGDYLVGVLSPEHEAAFADYLVRFVTAYRDEGIDVGWLTLQNEPSSVQTSYPSMVMRPDQQARIIDDHLGPALEDAGLDTQVLLYDHNWCDARPPGPCASEGPTTFPAEVLEQLDRDRGLVAGTALHCYGGDQVAANEAIHRLAPDREVWLTECSGGEWQSSRADAFAATSRLLVDDVAHWSSATILWNLALDPDGGPHLGGCDECRGVITIDREEPGGYRREVELDALTVATRFAPKGSRALATSVSPDGSGLASSSDEEDEDDDAVRAAGTCSPDRIPAALIWNPGAKRTLAVAFGRTSVAVEVDARSLTAVQAPEGVRCRVEPRGGR